MANQQYTSEERKLDGILLATARALAYDIVRSRPRQEVEAVAAYADMINLTRVANHLYPQAVKVLLKSAHYRDAHTMISGDRDKLIAFENVAALLVSAMLNPASPRRIEEETRSE
jgi:hypothetical protein